MQPRDSSLANCDGGRPDTLTEGIDVSLSQEQVDSKAVVGAGKTFACRVGIDWETQVGALATYALWISQYNLPAPSIPIDWTSWTFWQYSETGCVDGMQGYVDCHRSSGYPDDLQVL